MAICSVSSAETARSRSLEGRHDSQGSQGSQAVGIQEVDIRSRSARSQAVVEVGNTALAHADEAGHSRDVVGRSLAADRSLPQAVEDSHVVVHHRSCSNHLPEEVDGNLAAVEHHTDGIRAAEEAMRMPLLTNRNRTQIVVKCCPAAQPQNLNYT